MDNQQASDGPSAGDRRQSVVLRPNSSQVLRWRAVAHLPGNLALPSLRISSEHLQVRPVATWCIY